MELRYLFAVIMLLLAMWLTLAQIRSNSRNNQARQSRRNLRDKVADRLLARQFFGGPGKADQRKLQEQSASVAAPDSCDSEHAASLSFATDQDCMSAEFKLLLTRLEEKEQTILQLQQVLEELTSTTATRESVNFLQKQLIASRAKVLRQDVELKQLRVELGKRRMPAAVTVQSPDDAGAKPLSGRSSDGTGVGPLSNQSAQVNETIQANLVDPLTHVEAEAEVTQQNGPELRRLRSELESVRKGRSSPRTQIEELQTRLVERQKIQESVSEQPMSTVCNQSNKPLFAILEDQDDLKLIKGIGPVLEQRLNKIGVTTFRQLAGFTAHDIDRVSVAIDAFPGRMVRDDWVGKARELMVQKKDFA